MKILHLDDQPSTVEWVPINLMAAMASRDNAYYSLIRKGASFVFGEKKNEIVYQIVDEISLLTNALSENPDIVVLDFHVHGNNMSAYPDLVQENAIFWTAYREEANRAFALNLAITKGDRDSLLRVLLDSSTSR